MLTLQKTRQQDALKRSVMRQVLLYRRLNIWQTGISAHAGVSLGQLTSVLTAAQSQRPSTALEETNLRENALRHMKC